MREKERDRIFNLVKRIWAVPLTAAALLTSLVTTKQLWQGEADLIAGALLGLSVVTLLALLGYVFFARKQAPRTAGFTGPLPTRTHLYGRLTRVFAAAGFSTILVSCLAVGYFTYQGSHKPSDKLIVLVTTFNGEDQDKYRVTESVIEKLREATGGNKLIEIKSVPDVITSQGGGEAARQLGRAHKAGIVLWGWYARTDRRVLLTTHFELLGQTRYQFLRRDKQVLNVSALKFDEFEVQTDLSDGMSYLVLMAGGLANLESGDFAGAVESFTAAINYRHAAPEEMVDPVLLYFHRATANMLKLSVKEALDDYDEVVSRNPSFVATAHGARGLARYYAGDLEGALSDYDLATKTGDDDTRANALGNRGLLHASRGAFAEAVEDIKRAIEIRPSYPVTYVNLSSILVERGDCDAALTSADKAADLAPLWWVTHSQRGDVHVCIGDDRAAQRDYDRALELKPDDFLNLLNRGAIRGRMGDSLGAAVDLTRAIDNFEKANYGREQLALAYSNRGYAYKDLHNTDRSVADFTKAIELAPNDYDSYYGRGFTYLMSANYEHAVVDLRKALAMSSGKSPMEGAAAASIRMIEENDLVPGGR